VHIAFALLMLTAGAPLLCQSLDEVNVVPAGETASAPVAKTQPPIPNHTRLLRVDVDLVLVPVIVTDTINHPVLGLTPEEFEVYDGLQQQNIRYFSAEDGPISVGLLLDVSKSMENKFATAREAVKQFFDNANAGDDYFVITFSDKPKLLASSTQSIDEIQQTLSQTNPDGHTALLDAVYLAVAKMRNARYQRKVLLIISDGGDNHSRYGLREIKSLVKEANMEVYAIGIFDSFLPFRSFEEMMGKRWLGAITDETGGRTVSVNTLDKLPAAAASLSREMRTQYVLGYRPEKVAAQGRWRRIRVVVHPRTAKSRVQTYYKRGYQRAAK
jgi:Ca-activated chloride channel family protein